MVSIDFNVSMPTFLPHPKSNRFKDLTGQTFDRLTVVGYMGVTVRRNAIWLCRCECGTYKKVQSGNLLSASIKSCGCLRETAIADRNRTHGFSNTPEYDAYRRAKLRCQDEDDQDYDHYGGRGIQFLFNDIQQFMAVLGPRPSKRHSLDRIDVNGNYEPGNVRWATKDEQANNKRDNVLVTIGNVTKTATQWGNDKDHAKTITRRISRGWCPICAVELSVLKANQRPPCPHGGHPADNG